MYAYSRLVEEGRESTDGDFVRHQPAVGSTALPDLARADTDFASLIHEWPRGVNANPVVSRCDVSVLPEG